MILTDQQKELARWYFVEKRTITEISEWRNCSRDTVQRDLTILRAIFASHGQELPKFHRGRPRAMPAMCDVPVA